MKTKPTLASRLRQAREASGLSQRQLSEASGLGQDTIESLEQGRRTNPTVNTLAALAGVLGTTMEELMGGK